MSEHRKSNFEILRIVAIFMITIYHFCLHTASDYIELMPISNKLIEAILHMGGKIGVDIFVLLTGYFQYNKHFKFTKIIALETQMWFYCAIGLVVYVFLILNEYESLSVSIILKSFFPLITNAYWFITAYVGLYILTPFINLLLEHLKLKNKLILIGIMFLTQSFFPTFLLSREWVNNLTLFVFIYIIGATYGMHEKEIKKIMTKKVCALICFLSFIAAFVGAVILLFAANWIQQLNGHTNYLTNEFSPFMLIIAFSIFVGFSYLHTPYLPAINHISERTLGVYLFQSNPVISVSVLWPFFSQYSLYKLKVWPIIALFVALLVFTIGIGLDSIRIKIYRQIHINRLDSTFKKINDFINV